MGTYQIGFWKNGVQRRAKISFFTWIDAFEAAINAHTTDAEIDEYAATLTEEARQKGIQIDRYENSDSAMPYDTIPREIALWYTEQRERLRHITREDLEDAKRDFDNLMNAPTWEGVVLILKEIQNRPDPNLLKPYQSGDPLLKSRWEIEQSAIEDARKVVKIRYRKPRKKKSSQND